MGLLKKVAGFYPQHFFKIVRYRSVHHKRSAFVDGAPSQKCIILRQGDVDDVNHLTDSRPRSRRPRLQPTAPNNYATVVLSPNAGIILHRYAGTGTVPPFGQRLLTKSEICYCENARKNVVNNIFFFIFSQNCSL